ncbi:MAG: phosphatidate cytidylyltransferase [Alphaproteobacteria bacterium]|nr:phosphatidate cytidylyltransferase [Alphaproteobacteria bacterium]MDP6515702.1 phosphatidate cytidylyltransferase [Alphaproteobacteria bacterium]
MISAEFLRRAASALVLAPVILAVAWIGGPAFVILVLAAAVLMSYEWDRLTGGTGTGPGAIAIAVVACLAIILCGYGHMVNALLALALGALVSGAILWRGRGSPAWAGLGLAYITLPCLAVVWLRLDAEQGRAWLLWLFAVVWATDIGAYVIGRAIGGPKLAPRISPGKTWSGLAGGIGAAALVGGAMAGLLFGDREQSGAGFWQLAGGPRLAALAALTAIAAQVGDLAESGLKRRRGVKDSGALIPGHGGLLDRVDGLVVGAPFVAAVVMTSGGV